MADVFGGPAGDVCQDSGVYRSDYGQERLVEKGTHFPLEGGRWSRWKNPPTPEEIPAERARQQFWDAFS